MSVTFEEFDRIADELTDFDLPDLNLDDDVFKDLEQMFEGEEFKRLESELDNLIL